MRATLESEIQRQIEAALGSEPDFLLLRNTVGAAKHYADDGTFRMQKFGLGVGSPDLVGILKVRFRSDDPLDHPRTFGVWVAMEVKVPGEDATDEQTKVHHIWRQFGALVYTVHSVEEARAALDDARRAA